jgi:HPt (histidine-containing phosphotransfer) domain-containing protein
VRQGGEQLLHSVTRAFVDHWEPRLRELEQAVASDRRDEVGRISHGLRSSSQLVGLTGLGRLFARIEQEADAGTWSGEAAAARLRDEVHTAYEQVRAWIESHTGR